METWPLFFRKDKVMMQRNTTEAPEYEGDHAHQFINMFGDTVMVYWLDGQRYLTTVEAIGYFVKQGFTRQEATKYILDLPKKYN